MRRSSAIASALALLLGAAPALAEEPEADEEVAQLFEEREGSGGSSLQTRPEATVDSGAEPEGPGFLRDIDLSGYIQPTFGFRYRPNGVPRDKLDYSAAATTTGFVLGGEPVEDWTYTLHAEITGQIFNAITGDEPVDGDGSTSGGKPLFGALNPLALATQPNNLASAIRAEEVSIAYDPLDEIGFKVGQMRIPFTVQQQSPNTSLMFPTRSGPNSVFLRGSDLGALGKFGTGLGEGEASVSAGVFNGSGISETLDNERGALYALRFDVNPLGDFPFTESDTSRGPLRVGVGAGLLYLPSTVYDDAGFETMEARDLRASLSVRVAARGFYFQGEALRRQRTDSLSARPLIATGAYGQASYVLPLSGRLALAPIARLGWTERDQAFDPRATIWTEAGASLHVQREGAEANDIRLTLQYLGENRVTEGENAHGAVAQAQLRW